MKNLDPYMGDTMIVSFDRSVNDDSILTISRKEPDGCYKMINCVKGCEADEIYKLLVNWK